MSALLSEASRLAELMGHEEQIDKAVDWVVMADPGRSAPGDQERLTVQGSRLVKRSCRGGRPH
jgi:hypothetical protein